MPDIGEQLAGLPRVRAREPGMVGVTFAQVESAGLDLAEVEAWVRERGGYIESQAPSGEGLAAGRIMRRPTRTRHYFVIPRDRLPG